MTHFRTFNALLPLAVITLSAGAYALTALFTNETTIAEVAVNGGADTLNVGTTCIRLVEAVPPTCSGYLYIPNNNKHLTAAALTAKASNARVVVYYVPDAQAGHCPGVVFTPCSVISISQR
jgi:hypothetical protein